MEAKGKIKHAMFLIHSAWLAEHPEVIWASRATIQRVFQPNKPGKIKFNDSDVKEDNSIADGVLQLQDSRVILEDF